MNYSQIEKSIATRQPVRLYEFSRGALRWLYNTSSESIKRQNKLFKSLAGGLSDQGIITSDGGQSDNFTIIAPPDIEIATLFLNMPPSSRINLTVYNTHIGTNDIIPCWYGTVIGINYSENDRIKITSQTTDAMTNKPGATEVFTRQCNTLIYSKKCQVNKEDYKILGNILQTSITTVDVVAAENLPDGWFNGGFFEYSIGDGEQDRRFIESHLGKTLTLWGGTQGLRIGQAVSLYPGCNRTTTDCTNKFSNILNYQGFPHIQGRSPFDGKPVGW